MKATASPYLCATSSSTVSCIRPTNTIITPTGRPAAMISPAIRTPTTVPAARCAARARAPVPSCTATAVVAAQ